MPQPNKWSEQDKEYMRNNYGKVTGAAIAEKLGRSEISVRKQAAKLRLQSNYNPWTLPEEQLLRDFYPTAPQQLLVRMLDRNWEAIKTRALKLGLSRYTRKQAHNSYTVTLKNLHGEIVQQRNYKADTDAKSRVKTIITKWNSRFEVMLKNNLYYICVQNNLEKYITL